MSKRTKVERWIQILCFLALFLVATPLLILGFYNYPSADDWTLGLWTHQAVQSGGVLLAY